MAAAIAASLENATASLDENTSIKYRWDALKKNVHTAAEETLGHPQRNTPDWFHDLDQEIQALLDEKKTPSKTPSRKL